MTEKNPYLTRDIYKNYARQMEEKNKKRKQTGLSILKIKTYEDWANQ